MRPEGDVLQTAMLRPIVVRNLGGAMAGGLLIAALEFAVTRTTAPLDIAGQAAWLVRLSAHWTVSALPLGLCLLLVEYRARGSQPGILGYAWAVAAGAAVGAAVLALHGRYVDPMIARTAVGFDMALVDRYLYGLWQLGFWGTVGAVLHATELRQRRTTVTLRRENLRRVEQERRLLETRLATMQRQVEPEFVLATLGLIDTLYARDSAAADRVLDALIRFLRVAVPLLRSTTSTVGQELTLLRAYFEVIRSAPKARAPLSVDADATASEIRLPAGTLVSLVQRIAAFADLGTQALHVSTRRDGPVCRLDLSLGMVPAHTVVALKESVSSLAERLALVNGTGNSIALVECHAGGATICINLNVKEGEDRAEIESY